MTNTTQQRLDEIRQRWLPSEARPNFFDALHDIPWLLDQLDAANAERKALRTIIAADLVKFDSEIDDMVGSDILPTTDPERLADIRRRLDEDYYRQEVETLRQRIAALEAAAHQQCDDLAAQVIELREQALDAEWKLDELAQ